MNLKKYPWWLNLMVAGLCLMVVGRAVSGVLVLLLLQRNPPISPQRCSSSMQRLTTTPREAPASGALTELERAIAEGVRCRGNSCEVDRTLVDKVLANTSALAMSARFVPSFRDHKPDGFRVFVIRPRSIFAKLGLQGGDLIKTINGLDISTPDKAMETYVKLKPVSHFTVVIERRGANRTLDYQIR